MIFNEKNSAHHFRMQSEREQTLVKFRPHMHSRHQNKASVRFPNTSKNNHW